MNSTPAPNRIDLADGHSSGESCAGLTNQIPTAANSSKIANLMATITVSDRPIAFAPSALTTVSKSTAPIASDFTSHGAGVVVMNVAA